MIDTFTSFLGISTLTEPLQVALTVICGIFTCCLVYCIFDFLTNLITAIVSGTHK